MSVLIHTGDESLSRLEQLGLRYEWIEQALWSGEAEARTVSSLAPKGFEGMVRWGRTAESFREELCANGWSPDDTQNIARSVHPGGEFCIVVTTGGIGTGREEMKQEGSRGRDVRCVPLAKYPKGPATVASVEQNYLIDFDPEELARMGIPPNIGKVGTTWFLLFAVDGKELYFELSLPEAISEEGQFTSWLERIVFVPIDLGPDDPISGGFTEPTGPVNVPVSRK